MEKLPIIFPYVPQAITVHLGQPNQAAENITVSFPEYIKNAASSEIYPTWEESALRANILAITSFALNRVYTEYYRSQGYAFDITNSTAFDQAFIKGRSYFENISRLADELFNSYIRRSGFIEPLAAKFCNGTTVTCNGLSQWGSEELAQQGLNSVEILKRFYGNDIEIVSDAPVRGQQFSYPGVPLRIGSTGPYVTVIQTSLNKVAQNYPAIPRISSIDGVYGEETADAVREFQAVFSLEPDGIVGKATWYKIVRIYVAVLKLAELQSEGQTEYVIGAYPQTLVPGNNGPSVLQLQYMLSVAASFIPSVQGVEQNGIYDPITSEAVREFQEYAGLPPTGNADAKTWDALYDQLAGVNDTVFEQDVLFPDTGASRLQQYPGKSLQLGTADSEAAL